MKELSIFSDCSTDIRTPALGQFPLADLDKMFEVNVSDELIDVLHHFLRDTKTDRDRVKSNNSTETCRIKGCYTYNIFYKLSSATRQPVLFPLLFVNIGTFLCMKYSFLFVFLVPFTILSNQEQIKSQGTINNK